ncbi:MAG: hypothetical protein LBQ57_12300 [Spirochaetales bacterium]|nr:hypothetical protein [Spirochaetales bacterium]
MNRTVVFYRAASGCPFENFLDSLPGRIAKKITWLLAAIEELETVAELCFRRVRLHEDIQECYVSYGDAVFRILCFFYKRDIVILWGGLCVKFPDILEEQLNRAIRYRNDFLLQKGSVWAT